MAEHQPPTAVARAPVVIARGLAGEREVVWQLAEETPIALMLNSTPWTVMMASPGDIEDLAVGITVSEGLISSAEDILAVLVMPGEEGLWADVGTRHEVTPPSRSIAGRGGCGLCGVAEMAEAVRLPKPKGKPGFALDRDAVARAFRTLPAHQPLNALCHSVHAAAWCAPDGTILMAREDVGRHNALDKLIGGLLRQGFDPRQGFAVMSSRASFELIRKCVAVGIPHLAAISAPTALALKLAREAQMTLAARAAGDVVLFSPHED